jgi:hypothetical protein
LLQKVFVAATKNFFITVSVSNENDCDGFLPPQEAIKLIILQERISQFSKLAATKTFCSSDQATENFCSSQFRKL